MLCFTVFRYSQYFLINVDDPFLFLLYMVKLLWNSQSKSKIKYEKHFIDGIFFDFARIYRRRQAAMNGTCSVRHTLPAIDAIAPPNTYVWSRNIIELHPLSRTFVI